MQHLSLTLSLTLAMALLTSPMLVEAKKLKPKYYKSCYEGYKELRKSVPKPPLDVGKKAKTAGAVAGIAGRFGGFGGGLGGLAGTASTVAKYSETIADVAAFTENMSASFPNSSDRYLAYGDRMGTEAGEMQNVADFAMNSQDCYASAYTELGQSSASGEMKPKEIKKRHSEIKTGVANISQMLDHAAQYMDTNINAYNQAMNQETTGAGLDLGKMLSLAAEAQSVKTQVDGLTPGSGDGWNGTGWTPSEVRLEAHRQAMAARYDGAGNTNSYAAPAISGAGLFGGFGSLTSLASLGSVSPGLAAQVALNQGVSHVAAVQTTADQNASAPQQAQADPRVEALMQAGGDVQPYLEAYNRIKALHGMQKGVAAYVRDKP